MATRSVEEWARSVISTELGVAVEIHDDGSEPTMYDLRIGSRDAPRVAIECTGAVDSVSTETWNVGPARGSLSLSVHGNWTVEIASGANVRRIKRELEAVLQRLEQERRYSVAVDHALRQDDGALYNRLDELGLTHLLRADPGTGKVSFTMPPSGGVVNDAGTTLPGWVSDFLTDPDRAGDLRKLARSGAASAEVFIAVNLDGAPWSVVSYLTGDVTVVPTAVPVLPPPVTGVWACATTFATKGVYWDGSCWRVVLARPERA